MIKPYIIFFGSDPWSVIVLKKLEESFNIVGVVTSPNSTVANYFKGKIFTPEKLDENLKSDLFVVASYGKIIPQNILDIPKSGALNVHPSLLPKYRGPSPVPATILNGDKETGVTIIKMDEKMDHGPIVCTTTVSLSGQEDFTILITKLFQTGAELLVSIIPDFIAGKVTLEEQDHNAATYCKLMTKADGYFDINNPPDTKVLDRMIRAYNPWPGVWTRFRQGSSGQAKIVKFLPLSVIPAEAGIQKTESTWIPDQVRDDKFLVQMEGKKPMPLKDFLNGYPNFPLKNL